jgi:hypothetical protein
LILLKGIILFGSFADGKCIKLDIVRHFFENK